MLLITFFYSYYLWSSPFKVGIGLVIIIDWNFSVVSLKFSILIKVTFKKWMDQGKALLSYSWTKIQPRYRQGRLGIILKFARSPLIKSVLSLHLNIFWAQLTCPWGCLSPHFAHFLSWFDSPMFVYPWPSSPFGLLLHLVIVSPFFFFKLFLKLIFSRCSRPTSLV